MNKEQLLEKSREIKRDMMALTRKVTKRQKHPNECPDCHGVGQTKETATEVRQVGERYVTVARGSGCPKCFGIGRIPAKQSRIQ